MLTIVFEHPEAKTPETRVLPGRCVGGVFEHPEAKTPETGQKNPGSNTLH